MNNSRDPKKEETDSLQTKLLKRSVFVGLQSGCLTFFVAAVAIIVGFLVDTRLGIFPRWTLILLVGSAPLAIGGVYWMVRRRLKKDRAGIKAHNQDVTQG